MINNKFQAKRIDNGIWIYGDLHVDTIYEQDKYYINPGISIDNIHFIEVIPTTVSQYIGYNDTNSNEIYVGNRVKHIDGDKNIYGTVVFGIDKRGNLAFYIKWDEPYDSYGYRQDILHWIKEENIYVIE